LWWPLHAPESVMALFSFLNSLAFLAAGGSPVPPAQRGALGISMCGALIAGLFIVWLLRPQIWEGRSNSLDRFVMAADLVFSIVATTAGGYGFASYYAARNRPRTSIAVLVCFLFIAGYQVALLGLPEKTCPKERLI